jgi:transcriptional regulator with XRE-family HTH domain
MLTPRDVALAAMAETPGERLRNLRESRGIKPVKFAEMLGVQYKRVWNWEKNRGFTAARQAQCAKVLGVPSDYFSNDSNEAEKAREIERRRVFAEFSKSENGRKLKQNYPEIFSALEHTPLPIGWRVATTDFFEGLALVYRGQLTRQEFDRTLDLNIRMNPENSPIHGVLGVEGDDE